MDAKVKSGTDPADAVTAARSTVTKLYSKAYQQADSEERAEMLDALMGLEYGGERVYDLDTVTGWGVTVGSADITAALDTADADAVQEMIDERVRQLERADEEAATLLQPALAFSSIAYCRASISHTKQSMPQRQALRTVCIPSEVSFTI